MVDNFWFQLTFLEEPNDGETVESIMINVDVVDDLKMYCRGGTNCCGKKDTKLCDEGEGDCDNDDQCVGLLECGTNNCPITSGRLE